MRKNVASQKIGVQMVSATDGSAFTGSVTVSVTVDAGTQATGSVGSGACTHEGNGYHTYAPAQAETNGDLIAFTFTGTGAVPTTIQVYTVSYNPHDTVRLGLTALPNAAADAAGGLVISDAGGLDADAQRADVAAILVDTGTTLQAELDGIQADTEDLQTRVPAALVGGRIDANVGAISADATAADNAEAFFDGTGYAGTNNVIPTVTTTTTATNVTTVNGLAANVITAASMAADASAEIADAVWDEDATGHQTGGTFGQAIGDPGADTNTIFKATVTDATGATVGVDVVDLKTQIGTAGAGLTAIDLPDQTMNITGNITGNLSGSVGSVSGNVGGSVASVATGGIAAASFAAGAIDAAAIAANAIGASELNADAIDEIWDELIGDSTITARQAMKAFMATLAGKLSGAATTTVVIRNVADDVDRITATVDADGNRSAITLSL